MRGYVEMLERLEYFAPEGHTVTDAEICAAIADQHAARLDAYTISEHEFVETKDGSERSTGL